MMRTWSNKIGSWGSVSPEELHFLLSTAVTAVKKHVQTRVSQIVQIMEPTYLNISGNPSTVS